MPRGLPGKKITNKTSIPIATIMAPKGGVGKTTAVLNYASVLSKKLRVLVLDCDPQCNLSQTILEMLMREKFPWLSEEHCDTLTRQIAGLVIENRKQPFPDSVNIILLKSSPSPEELSKKQVKLNRTHTHTLLFYTREEAVDLNDGEQDSADESEQVHARYVMPDGTLEDKALGGLPSFIDDDRWQVIESNKDLSEEERNNLLAQAYLAFDRPAKVIQDQILLALVKKPVTFVKREQIKDFSEFDEGFIVTTNEDNDWEIIHKFPQKEVVVPLEGLEPVLAVLTELSDVPMDKIPLTSKEDMSIALASCYGYRNIMDAFDPIKLKQSSSRADSEALAQATDVFKIKPQSNSDGEVILLAGSYYLQLKLGGEFSFGVQAIQEDEGSFIASYRQLIFAFNTYVRTVAKLHKADVVLVDINPGSHDLNAVLCMISNGLVAVLNPEAYSDHAMRTLDVILSNWAKKFAPLYAIKERLGHHDLISSPYFLGYSLQKVPKSGRDIVGAAKLIAQEIRGIFDESVMPGLEKHGMLPPFNILGVDQIEQLFADINRFTQETVALQKRHGVIASENNRIMHDTFAKTVQRLFAPFFAHWGDRAPRLSQYLPTIDPDALPFERDMGRILPRKIFKAFRKDLGRIEKSRLPL